MGVLSLPIFDLFDLVLQQSADSFEFFGRKVEFVLELLVVVKELLSSVGLILDAAYSDFPLFDLLLLMVECPFQLLIIILPLFLFVDLLLESVLPLPGGLKLVLLIPQYFV